jgi:adenylate cyclase
MKKIKRKHIQAAGGAVIITAMFISALLIGNLRLFVFSENKIHDTFFQVRDAFSGYDKAKSSVVIVGIDRTTLAENPEPLIFWDDEFTKVLEALSRAKPGVIGFDILHLSSVDSKRYDFGKMKLGNILMSNPGIVLPYAIDTDDVAIPVFLTKRYREKFGIAGEMSLDVKLKLLAIAERARGISFGYANLSDDDDGIVRRVELYDTVRKSRIESFSLKIFLKYEHFTGANVARTERGASVNGFQLPGTLTINYNGAPGSITMIPMTDVLHNAKNESYLRKNFKDKIVLFGSYDPALGDMHNTPFISSGLGITRGMYGVEIVANAVDTLVRKKLIYKSPLYLTILFCFIFSVLGMMLSRLRTARGLSGFIAAELLYVLLSFMLFAGFDFLASMLPPVALFLSFFTGYLFSHYLVGREKFHLQTVLSSYLDPRIVERVVAERGSEILKGEHRFITVMFADIRNFTSLSESRKNPEDVVEILNIYLPAMSAVIRSHEGCVDKFIGDGIMAFWNAPNDVKNHAQKAVNCAIEMKRTLVRVNSEARARGLIKNDLAVGIGIHTGSAVVGNVGSEIKNDYTAIGDTVNTASRLEGKTKDLGYQIVISEAVKVLLAGDDIGVRSAGTIAVKGKKKKIKVFGIFLH